MRIDVAFTPAEAAPAPIAIVVDVLRATSTIAQALAAGYRRVLCCAEIEEALELRAEVPDSIVGGERNAVQVEGFDVGASPREFLEALAETLILSTTNGTRAILRAAKSCDEILLGSLLNLAAVARVIEGVDSVVVCAGSRERSPSTMPTVPGASSSSWDPTEAMRRSRPSSSPARSRPRSTG